MTNPKDTVTDDWLSKREDLLKAWSSPGFVPKYKELFVSDVIMFEAKAIAKIRSLVSEQDANIKRIRELEERDKIMREALEITRNQLQHPQSPKSAETLSVCRLITEALKKVD